MISKPREINNSVRHVEKTDEFRLRFKMVQQNFEINVGMRKSAKQILKLTAELYPKYK
jgi:hypothetical protein